VLATAPFLLSEKLQPINGDYLKQPIDQAIKQRYLTHPVTAQESRQPMLWPSFLPFFLVKKSSTQGFTLSELLIALAVLGLIATFTIPKVLYSTQSKQMNSITKELASAVVNAIMAEEVETGPLTVNADINAILDRRLMTLGRDTSSMIDVEPGNPFVTSIDCSNTAFFICRKLQNGAVISIDYDTKIGGTSANDGFMFFLDPDGKLSDFKAIAFFIYVDHGIKTRSQLKNPSYVMNTSSFTLTPRANSDPSWFSWN
jgi:prepilin-type N-terminal cleavage/methylation domain-containing protein